MFSIDIRDHIKLAQRTAKGAQRVKWAVAFFLTELAWKGRQATLEELPKRMKIRNLGFIKKHLLVHRANGRQGIAAQEAHLGTTEGKRFSGLREQAEGGVHERFATYRARGGSAGGQVKHKYRMKAGKNFLSPREMPTPRGDKGEAHRAHVFLRFMSNQKWSKDPFVLTGHAKFPAGLYQFEGGAIERGPRGGIQRWPKLQTLQRFGEPVRVKANDWRQAVIDILGRRVNTEGLWARCWERSSVLAKK
jgi:hypothetical protein